MKRKTLLCSLILPTLLQAQSNETVSIGAGYTQQVWYSLQNGIVSTRAVNEWDLAFEIPGFTASILVNTQKAGLAVYGAPYSVAQWDLLDTTGLSGWTALHNSDTSWSAGAFNQGSTGDEFDLGWGNYNMVTHAVVGDSLYVVKLANGQWRKLRIDVLAMGSYQFTSALLDGTDEQVGLIVKTAFAGKNFGYYDLETNTVLDREPVSAAWDLTFTKYITFIPIPYGVTGVLHNRGVTAIRVAGIDPSEAVYDFSGMATAINTIGYDWKSFDMDIFQWVIDDSLTYFVKDLPGNIWKVVFTGFGGTANGQIDFTKELVSAVGLVEPMATGHVQVFPNPVRDGLAMLVFEVPASAVIVRVYDAYGRQVGVQRRRGGNAVQQVVVDLSGLTAGVYILQAEYAGVLASTRVFVE